MSISRKFQRSKSKYTLSQKIISAVTAAGFIMQPFTAFAGQIVKPDGENLINNGVADIWADKVVGNAAVNVFNKFNLSANEIANMYFGTSKGNHNAANLVNFVNDRIDINGTVNAVQNSQIGGNLFFLSKEGMAVGKSGVINTGSLYVMTPTQDFMDAAKTIATTAPDETAAEKLAHITNITTDAASWQAIPLNSSGTITVLGKVNAVNEVRMRAAKIGVGKNVDDSAVDNVAAGEIAAENAYIKTGITEFGNIVNINYNDESGNDVAVNSGITNLTATKTGSGDIVLEAYVDASNDKNEIEKLPVIGGTILGAATETVENTFTEQEFAASVDIYGEVNATGKADINATAINSNADFDETLNDYKANNNDVAQLATIKADVNIGGTVKAVDDVNIKAEAVNRYVDNSGSFGTALKLAVSSGTPLTGDVAYSVLNTEANVNVASGANVASENGSVDIDAKAETLAASAASTTGLKFKAAGGLTGANVPATAVVYTGVDNRANVTVEGNIKAGKDISIDADADMKVEADNKMSLKGTMANQFVVGVTVAGAENSASVDIKGTGNKVSAVNDLSVNAKADSDFTSSTSIKAPEASAITVAVNVTDFNSNANVNVNTDLTAGSNLNVEADNTIVSDNVNAETKLGSNKYISAATQVIKTNAEGKITEVKDFINGLKTKLGFEAGGSDDIKTQLQLSEILKAGATVTYSGQEHKSGVNIGKNGSLTAQNGMLGVNAQTLIEDAHIAATGTTYSYNDAYPAGATLNASVLVNNMDNSSSVVVADRDAASTEPALSGKTGVDVNASVRFEYNRIKNMIQDVKDAYNQIATATATASLDDAIKEDFVNNFLDPLQTQITTWEIAFKTADETLATSDSGVLSIGEAAKAGYSILNALNNLNTMLDSTSGSEVADATKASIQGASDLLTSALAFADPNSYGNFAASSASKGSSGNQSTVGGHIPSAINGAGTVIVNNVDTVSKVEIGSNTGIASDRDVNINAESFMKDVTLGGLNAVPITNSGGGTTASIGATVNYSDFNTDTVVAVNNGASITGGNINIAGSNVIDHVSVAGSAGIGPSGETQSGGIVLNGMLSFVNGSSDILTVVDDGASLTVDQKQYTETVEGESGNTEDTGNISISGHNDTNIVNVAAGLNLGSGSGAVGVGLAYNDFAVKNIAGVADVAGQIKNLYSYKDDNGEVAVDDSKVAELDGELNNTYTASSDTNNKGSIGAYGFNVDAATDGSIQSVSAAASANKNDDTGKESFFGKLKGKFSNVENKVFNKLDEKTGQIFGSDSGKANEMFNKGSSTHGTGGGIKLVGSTSGKGGFMPSFSIAGSGSVSLNSLNNATEAIVDNVNITMQPTSNKKGDISVTARDTLYAGAYSGAAALQWKKGGSADNTSVGFSGAAGVNDIDNAVKATIKKSTISNEGKIDTMALSGGEQLALGLGLAVVKADGTSGVSGNAAVSVNLIDHDVEALLENNTVTNANDINVAAYARDIENTGGGTLSAGQQKVGVGATVAVAQLNNNISAGIKGGSYTKVGNVDVDAMNALKNITVGIAAGATVPSGNGGSANVQGAGVYNEVRNATNAFITGNSDTDKVVITTVEDKDETGEIGNVKVIAQDVAVNEKSIYEQTLAGKDGKTKISDGKEEIAKRMGKDFDITGKTELAGVEMGDAENELNKNKADNEKETVNIYKVDEEGKTTGSSIITVAGGLAATTGKGSGGAAVAITDIENTYTADVKYADITADELDVDAGSNSNIVTVAGGIAAANKGSGVGSVSWNDVINTANVNIANSDIHAQQTTATAANQAQIVSVGGQISGAGKAAVGATLSYVGLDNTTKVNISTTEFDERTANKGTNVTAEANNTSDSYNIGAGVSAGGTESVSGTVVVTQTKGTAGAVMNAVEINNAKKVTASAVDDTDILSVIGGINIGGKVAAGAGVSYTEIGGVSDNKENAEQHVTAEIKNSTINSDGAGSTVEVKTKDEAHVINVAIGVGGAGNVAVQGASATTLINKTTSAEITDTNIDEKGGTSADVTVDAQNDSEITSSADVAAAAGSGAGVGAGIAVNRIKQNTQAALNGGTMYINNLTVNANGTPRIENIGIGAGAGGTAGVTGSVAVNMIANNVTAHIGNGANVVADNNVGVIATSDEQIANYAGVLAGGGTAGAGASVSVNQINGNTSATVGGDKEDKTSVTAFGNSDALATNTGVADSEINNALISDETVAINSKIDRTTETRKGLVVDASSTRDMKSFLVTAGVAGNAGIAGTVNVNMIKGATNAGVANTTINSGSASKADAGNVFVNAGDYTNMSGFVGSLGVGIEGAGVGLASDTNTVERDVTAIVSGSNVNATNKFEIDAESMQGISSYSLGGGIAGMGAGVAGVVTVAELENTTKAALQNSKVNANTVIVNANHKGIVNAGNTGVGVDVVGAGIGLSVGVLKDNSETYAEVSGDNKAEDTITAAGNVKIAATNTAVAKPVIYSTGAGGFAGVAGATSINNLNSKVVTNIKDVAISSTGESISGTAQNNFEVDASMGSFAGAAVGAGAGVTVNTIGSTVQTNVSNSDLEAAKDVILTAEEIRNIKQLSTNAAIGGVAAGVNIAITNVGQKVENTVDGDETVSNAADKIDEANNFYVDKNGKNYGSDLTSGANDALETAGIGSITLDVDAGDGSTKDEAGKIVPIISQISVNITNSDIDAGGTVKANAAETDNIDMTLGGASAGIAAGNVGVGILNVNRNVGVNITGESADKTTINADTINIGTDINGEAKLNVYQGTAGVVGANVVVAEVNTTGSSNIKLDDAKLAAKNVNVLAQDRAKTTLEALGLSVSGLAGFGALAANADNNSNVTVTVTDSEFNANEDEGEITIETNKANEVTAIADNVAGGMVGAAGMGATVSDNGSSVINLTGNTMQANNNIDVTAKTDSVLTAEILNGAVGTFAVGAVSAAMVDAGSDNNRMVTAVNIGSGNTFAAQNINFNADSDITQNIDMLAFSVSGTYSASGNGTDLAAYTEASVTADANNTYKGASDDENGNVDFEASNSVTQTADTSGISAAGAFATGTNIGNTTSNLKTKVDIKGSSADSNINNLTANANSYADIDNNVNGDGGAIADVSPYAAKVNNNYTADTDVTVGGNWNTTGSFTAQAVNGMDIDLKSDAVRAAVVGGSGTWLANTINNAANVVVNSANITTGGAQSYIAQNNVDYAGEIAGSGYGGLNVNATDYSDDLDFTAGVNITGSTLHGTGDDASITAFASTQGDITAKNSLKSAGVIPVALAFSDYDIDYNNSVNVSGSSLTTDKADADITLAATDDTVVKLETIADTQGGAVGAASAKADNAFDRANRINVDSTSTLLSSNDANLYAGANISGITSSLNLQVLADAYNKTALPLVTVPSVENRMTQANQVAIGGNIESVRHVNLKAGKGDTTVTESAKEYNIYQGTTGSGSVASTTLGDTVGGETTNNFVDVTGNVTAGVHNSLNITINGTINIDKNNQSISYSDFNANAAEDWFNDDTIQKTDTTIENNLMERYNEITGLMQQYQESTNEYKSFKQEKENLLKEMLNMGMAYEDEKGNITPVNEISVPAVEVPDIVVSGGNINIDADVAKGNGNLTANSAGSVNITNNSDAYLIINDITMKDAGGQIKFNGSDIANVTSDAGNNLSKDNITTGESSGEVPSINIIGTAGIKDNIQADIGIFGDLTNTAGDITVKNNSYGITVLGNVNGRNISLIAENGNVTQTSTEGFINIGNDPVTKYQFSEKVAKAIQEYIYDQYVSSDGNYPIPAFADYNAYLTWIKENIVGDAYGISESDLTYKVDESKGIVAGGNVYINGLNVNIAGLIQSGYGDYSTTLDETAKTAVEKLDSEWQSSKESLSDNEVIGNEKYCINGGGAVYNTDTDVWDYEVKVYYNPSTGELLTDSINIGGGKIYITGNISSTGGGRIMAMDGAADINIDTSAVDRNVKINSIANNDVSGLVSITDKQKGTVTEYTNGQTRTYQIGTAAGAWQNGNSSYKYSPKDGLQYQWTGGVSGEVIKKYQYKENFLFWGLLDYDTTETFIKGLEGKVESIDDLITSTSGGEGKTDSKDSGVIVTTGGTGADFSITGSYTNTGEEKYTDIVADMKYDGIAGKIFGYGETTYTWSGTQGTASSTTTSIAADKDISIGFIGSGNKEGNINVTGNKDMLLAGNISNAEVDGKGKGSVTLTSETGSVSAIGSANINSDVVNIKAATGVDVNHAAIGNTANINVATDSGNISFVSGAGDLKIEQMITGITYKDDGTIDTDNIDASTGSVYLEAQGDILDAAKGDYAVKGQRIDLVSHTGSIGTKDKALTVLGGSELYSSDAMASSVNAQANGDIVLTQTDDNMRLGTIVSENGDAVLTVNNGSFVDAHPSENNDNSSAQDKIDLWLEAGLINSGDEANESSKAAAQAKQERMEGLEAKAAVLAEKSEGKHTVKDYTDAAADLAAALSGDPKKSEAAKNLQDAKNTYINAYKDTSASHSKAIADAEANGATANEIAAINEDYKNRYNSITEAYLDAQAAVYGDGFNTEEQQLISSYAEVNVDESNYGWSKNQLLYAIQESVLTSEPGTVQTVDTPNVTANNITLNAAEGGIGIDGEAKVIDYANLNKVDNLKLLAQAKAGDLTWDEKNQQVTIRQQQAITVQVKQDGGKVDVTGKYNVYLAGVQGTELNVNGITTTGDIRLQGDDGVYVDGTLTGVDLTITGGTGDIMGAGSDDYVDTNISGTLDANANGSIYISQNGDLKVLTVATNALADLKATNNILMSDVEGSQAQGYINAQTLNLAAGGNIGTDAINTNALRILNNGVVVNAKANKENGDIILAGVTGTGLDGELVLGAIEGANLDVTSAGNVSIGKDASEGETAVEGSIDVNGDASISAEDGSVTQTADSNITANAVNASATENILLGSKENSVNSFVVNGLGTDNSINGSIELVSAANNSNNVVNVEFGKVVDGKTVGLTVNGGTVDVTSTGTSGLNISGGSLTTTGKNAGNVTFASAGSITAGTSVNSAADIVMDAKGAVTNTGSLTAQNNVTVDTTAGAIELGGSVTANTGTVTVHSDKGAIHIGDDNGNGTVNAGTDVSITTNEGNITTTGAVSGGSNVKVDAGTKGNIELGGIVNAEGGSVDVDTQSGDVTTKGEVTGKMDVTINSDDGDVTIGGKVQSETGSTHINAGTEEEPGITEDKDGNVTVNGEVASGKEVIVNANNGSITVTGNTTASDGNVQTIVKGDGNINLNGSVSASGNVQAEVTGEGDISTGENATVNGTDITFTTNDGSITTGSDLTADANVNLNTNTGDIILGGDTTAKNGNITININKEGSLKDAANTDNTLSAFSPDNDASKGNIYINLKGIGDVDLSEIYADNDARVDVADGNLTLGTINGQLVAIQLRTQDREMNVGEIIAGTQIVLTGSDMTLDQIAQRPDADGMLVITPDNAEADKPIDNFTIGDIKTNADSGIRFDRLWVNNSDIHISEGQLWFDKLYVEDNAHFSNDEMTAAIYGKPPLRDGSDSVYWINTEENRPESSLDMWLNGTGDWMYLRFTDDHIQESNGILLTLDEYDYVYDQRFTAENHLRWQHGRYLDEDWKQAYGYGLSLHNRYGLIDYQEFTETNAGADEVAVEA